MVKDITEFKFLGEKLYLSPVLDSFNGEFVTYTIGSKPIYSLISEMIEKALEHLPKERKLLMHSDIKIDITDETISSCSPKKRN